jgi:hypothetical protein
MIAAGPAANVKSTECESQQVHVVPFSKKAAFVATERYRLTNWLGENAEFQVSTIREKDQDYLSLKVRFRKSNADEPSGGEIRNGLVIPEGAQLFILMANDNLDFEIHKGSIEDFKMAVQCVSQGHQLILGQ